VRFFYILLFFISSTISSLAIGDSLRVVYCVDNSDYYCENLPGYSKNIQHIDSIGRIFEINRFYFSECNHDSDWIHLEDNYYEYDSIGRIVLTVDSQYNSMGTYLRKTETVFDSSGNKILETVVHGNPAQPDSLYRYSFGFNSLQQKTFELSEQWYSVVSDWDTIEYRTWNYDSLDRVSEFERSTWSVNDYSFTGFSNEYFFYDSINNIVEDVSASFSIYSNYDSTRYESIYDSTNLLRIQFYQQWDTTGMSWINENRIIFEYDSLDRKVLQYYCYCGDSTCSDTLRKTTYEYDSFGNLIESQYYDYVFNGIWEFTGRDWTYYDANTNIIDEGSGYINFSGCDWASWSTYTYNADNQLTYSYSEQSSCNYSSSTCYYYSLNEDSLLIIVNQTSTYCPYDTIHPIITVAGGVPPYNFQWSPNINLLDSGIASPRIVTDTNIIYTLTVTDYLGNSKTEIIGIQVYPKHLFPVTLSTFGVPCEGDPFYITFNSDSLIQPWSAIWYRNELNAGVIGNDTIQASIVGSYSVLLIDDLTTCTLMSDSVEVNLFPEIPAHIYSIGDTIVCRGETVTLTSEQFPSMLWNTGDTSMIINTGLSGSFFVTVIDSNGCTDTSNVINVIVNPLPAVTLGNDTSLCTDQTITLDAGAGFITYLWQDSSTMQSISTSYQSEDSLLFSVIVTDNNSCSNSDSVMVIFNPLPAVTLGNDTFLCATQSITLDAGGGFMSYQWQDNTNLQTVSVSSANADSVLIFVTVTDFNSCSNSDSMTVIFNELPEIDLGNDTILCVTQSITLDAGPGFLNYQWQDGTTSQTITLLSLIADSTLVFATVTDYNTCLNSDTMVVVFDLCAAVGELNNSIDFQLYPNPSENVVNVLVSGMNSLNEIYFSLYDLLGRMAFMQKVENANQLFDLGSMNKGVYQFIFIQQGTQLKSGKFVIE
jgi:hypothetical protein